MLPGASITTLLWEQPFLGQAYAQAEAEAEAAENAREGDSVFSAMAGRANQTVVLLLMLPAQLLSAHSQSWHWCSSLCLTAWLSAASLLAPVASAAAAVILVSLSSTHKSTAAAAPVFGESVSFFSFLFSISLLSSTIRRRLYKGKNGENERRRLCFAPTCVSVLHLTYFWYLCWAQ